MIENDRKSRADSSPSGGLKSGPKRGAVALGKLSERNAFVPRAANARSKVSNGTIVLPGVDGRSALARRYGDILAALASDQGGADRLSETRLQLCRRFAGASALAEQLESQMASGKPIDVATYATLISTAVRLSQRLGIDRRSKVVTPTLQDYLDGKAEVE